MSQIPPSGAPQGSAQNPQILNELQTEISSEAAPLLQFLTEHAIKIMLVLGLFVVAVGGLGVYNWQQESAMKEAQAELNTINMNADNAQRLSALEGFLAKAPESLQSSIQLSLAEVSMQEKDYNKAATAYGQLAQLNAGTAVGLLGALNQGQALILAGKGKDAVAVLEPLVAEVPTNQNTIVQQALAEAALLGGDTAKAKAAFEAIANATTGTESEFYRYRARNVDAANK